VSIAVRGDHRMNDDKQVKKKWVFYGRQGLVPTIMGISILVFVIVTGERYAWTMWIAVPMMMGGLGYIFIVNAIASFIAISHSGDPPESDEEKQNAS